MKTKRSRSAETFGVMKKLLKAQKLNNKILKNLPIDSDIV